MKKFIYLSLASLLVANTATNCMEQIIKADEEAGTDNPPAVVLETDTLKVQGPELPSREESARNFLRAASDVSKKGRFVIASSNEHRAFKEAYQTHVAIHKGDKRKAKADLFGLADSFSDDEEYYKEGVDDADKTYQKIVALDAIKSIKHRSNVDANNDAIKRLQQDSEEISASLKELYIKKGQLKQELAKAQSTQETLKTVDTVFGDNKAQEMALLYARRGTLTEEIKRLEERITHIEQESNALLDNAEVSESIMANAFTDHKTLEADLVKAKKALQQKLNKVEAVIKKLEAPKQSWLW